MDDRDARKSRGYTQIIRAVSIALALAIFATVGIALYASTSSFFARKLLETERADMLQLTHKLDIFMDNFHNLSMTLSRNQIITEQLERLQTVGEPFDINEILREIQRLLLPVRGYSKGVHSVAILTRDRVFSHNAPSLLSYDYDGLVAVVARNQGEPIFVCSTADDEEMRALEVRNKETMLPYAGGGEPCVMRLISRGDNVLGVLIIKMSSAQMSAHFRPNTAAFMWDGSQVVWSGRDEQARVRRWAQIAPGDIAGVSGILRRGGESLLYRRLARVDWVVCYAGGWKALPLSVSRSFVFLAALLVLGCLISAILARLTVRRVMMPLFDVVSAARGFMLDQDVAPMPERGLRYGLRDRIMLLLMLVILVPLCLFAAFYYANTSSVIYRELSQGKSQAIEQMDENIEITLSARVGAARTISFDSGLQRSLLVSGGGGDPETYRRAVEDYHLLLGRYYNFCVYDRAGVLSYRAIDGSQEHHARILAAAAGGQGGWSGPYRSHTGISLVTLAIQVISIDERYPLYHLRPIGTIVLDLEESALSELFADSATPDSARVAIRDSAGVVLISNDKSHMYSPSRDASSPPELAFSYPIAGTGWTLVGSYDVTSIADDLRAFLYGQFYMLPVVALVLVVISFELSRLLTVPVDRVARLMRRMRVSGAETLPDSAITEIDQLSNAFNDMLLRIRRLTEEMVEAATRQSRLEKQKKDAEVVSLQSQIKPHFLCNTLDVVRCLIDSGERGDASLLLREVSNLFRYGISKQETIISVEQELSYTRAYAAIMITRFPGRLDIRWDIARDVLCFPVMKVLLQPLVENAIEHGVIPQKNKGVITVRCHRADGFLRFSVSDDGVGMDAQEVGAILTAASQSERGGEGVGLRNVRQRLDIYYGGAARMEIVSEKWKGAEVRVYIPESAEWDALPFDYQEA